jgi:hypothetical protein
VIVEDLREGEQQQLAVRRHRQVRRVGEQGQPTWPTTGTSPSRLSAAQGPSSAQPLLYVIDGYVPRDRLVTDRD